MSLETHIGQILPLKNHAVPISNNTVLHASFTNTLYGLSYYGKVSPYGYEKSLYFDGSSTQIKIKNQTSTNFTDNATVEIWIKPDFSLPANARLFEKSSDATIAFSIQRDFATSNGLLFTDGTNTLTGGTLTLGVWNHIAITVNAGTAIGYINGAQVFSGACKNPLTTANTDYVLGGPSSGSAPYYPGYMSDLRIWNYARSAQQISTNMNMEFRGDESGLVAYYKLNEGSGTLATDSALGSDAYLKGTIKWSDGRTVVVRRNDGKFSNAISLEDATINMLSSTLATTTGATSVDYGNRNSAILSIDSNTYWESTSSLKVVTPGVVGDEGTSVSISSLSVPAGTPFTGSAYLKGTGAIDLWLRLSYSDSTSYDSAHVSIVLDPNNWQRSTVSSAVETGKTCTGVDLIISTPSATASVVTFWADAFQIEQKTWATSFVNGSRPDGTLQYNASLLNLAEGTISCWFKPSAGFFANAGSSIFAHSTAGSNNLMQIYRFATTSQIAISMGSNAGSPLGGAWALLKSTTNIVVNTWYMLTLKWKASTGEVYLYVNSLLESSTIGQVASGFPSTRGTISVGNRLGQTKSANGIIDELRIENVMVSGDEVVAWYHSNAPFYNYLDYLSST